MTDHDERSLDHTRAYRASPWPNRVALATAAATLVLIFVGGLVTNTGAGLAVPDWPTTFGHNMFLYPWSRMVDGIFYEHSHRLIGSLVGLLTVVMALVLWWKEPKGSARRLAMIAVGAVIVQGVLGGLRVILTPTGSELALIHGLLAHAFFALIVSVTVLTSAEWKQRPGMPMMANDGAVPRLCLLTTGTICLQIVFGGMLTHIGDWIWAHLVCAALVAVAVCYLARHILREHSNQTQFARPVTLLLGLLGLQLLLGLGSYVNRFTSLEIPFAIVTRLALPTVHRITGALMLAACVVLTLRAYRMTATRRIGAGRQFVVDRARI